MGKQKKNYGSKIKLKPIKNNVMNKNKSDCNLSNPNNIKKIIIDSNVKKIKNINRSTEEIETKWNEDINIKNENSKKN